MIMVVRITVVIVVNRLRTSSFGIALGWLLLSTLLSTILEVTQFGDKTTNNNKQSSTFGQQ